MKNIRQDDNDTLRPEYQRSDFGEMVRGKYADAQVALPELVRLLLACIGEDVGLKFTDRSPGRYRADHTLGEWTYEFDDTDQITLRYWFDKFSSIKESVSNPTHVTTAQERSNLLNLLLDHVRALRARVDAL